MKLIDIINEIIGDVPDDYWKLKGQTIDLTGVPLYHGTTYQITSPEQLNPLFRETDTFKKHYSSLFARTGSSEGGIGIYFGRNPQKLAPEDAQQYMKKNDAYFAQGFLYQMILKPNSKVLRVGLSDGIQKIQKRQYEDLISQGYDAITDGGPVVLINPNAVGVWKEVDRWQKPFDVTLREFDDQTQKNKVIDTKRFWHWDELVNYLGKELGVEPNRISLEDHARYSSKDPDSTKMATVERIELK